MIRLERTLVEVFLGPDAIPVNVEQLRSIRESEWPSLRLGLHPTVQLLDSRWRMDEVLRAIEENIPVCPAAPSSHTIMVWRSDCVCYRALDEVERNALTAICAGEEFMIACDKIAADCYELNFQNLIKMLFRWLADGIVVRIQSRISNDLAIS